MLTSVVFGTCTVWEVIKMCMATKFCIQVCSSYFINLITFLILPFFSILKGLSPNHRGQDSIVLIDGEQTVSARFTYGPFSFTCLDKEQVLCMCFKMSLLRVIICC